MSTTTTNTKEDTDGQHKKRLKRIAIRAVKKLLGLTVFKGSLVCLTPFVTPGQLFVFTEVLHVVLSFSSIEVILC